MIRALLIALALLGCAPCKPQDPIVVILRDGQPVCSGFAVGPNQVLTAAHCVGDRPDVAIVTAEQWAHTSHGFTLAHVQLVDSSRDIASLSSDHIFDVPLKMRGPVTGETVYARSIMFGEITDGNVLPGAGSFVDTTMSIIPGWSGSPVLALDGSVVGFVHSCIATVHGLHRKCLPHNAQIGVLP